MRRHHDYYGIIDDDSKENRLGGYDDFDGFHENEDVTSEADGVDMGALNKLTGRGNNFSEFLMGVDWDKDLHEDD